MLMFYISGKGKCRMELDKRTGRGCAWCIASNTIARKLVADGILQKEISREFLKYRCDSIRVISYGAELKNVYVVLRKGVGATEQPLWTPTFIDPAIWQQAASQFRPGERLDRCVEKYLLPEMEDYLQSLSDSALISMVREFLLDHGVINKPILQCRGITYYFTENEVYTQDTKSSLFPYEKRLRFNLFEVSNEICFNSAVWTKAATHFMPGMSLRECIGVFLGTKIDVRPPREPSPTDQLVQGISPPVFEREPENENTATFDRIRISVGLPRYHFSSWEALRDEVKKHQREIYRLVLDKIESDRRFLRYGVPINFLKLSDVTLLRNYSLEFIFELKGTHNPAQEPQDFSC